MLSDAKVVGRLDAQAGHSQSMCLVVRHQQLLWNIEREGKEEDSLRVFCVADVAPDKTDPGLACIRDSFGQVLKSWDIRNFDPQQLNQFIKVVADNRMLDSYDLSNSTIDAAVMEKCKPISQLGQDLWVLQILNRKQGGFFVDIGAGNGIELSNSLRLERDYGWKGICIEPSRQYEALQGNRTCSCVQACLSGCEESVSFLEDYLHGEDNHFSGIEKYLDCHQTQGVRKTMTTCTLASVLDAQNAPSEMDYLSIDTEGSELKILEVFPFDRYTFRAMTVEHNYVEPKRTQMQQLLARHGYVHIPLPSAQWDDWFVHQSVASPSSAAC